MILFWLLFVMIFIVICLLLLYYQTILFFVHRVRQWVTKEGTQLSVISQIYVYI